MQVRQIGASPRLGVASRTGSTSRYRAPDTDVVMGAGTKTQKPRVAVADTGRQAQTPLSRNQNRSVRCDDRWQLRKQAASEPNLPYRLTKKTGGDASFSLATAVQELTMDGLAAMLNAVSVSHVLLGVRAMRLVQISGFEIWRNGMTQQPQTRRFDVSTAPSSMFV